MDAPCCSNLARPNVRGTVAAILIAWLAIPIAHAAPASLKLSGSAVLRTDQPQQHGDAFALKATLIPRRAASASATVHEGGAFAMIGKLAAVPLICYGDTIFRDDFDGDGF
ncbi:MAG: hypothetical protein ABIS07_18645 [Dokdonella sp.]